MSAKTMFKVTDFTGRFSDTVPEDEARDILEEWNGLGYGPCTIDPELPPIIPRDGRDDEGLI